MDKYGTGDDPSCYPGTNVLRNRFNITDQNILDEAESEYTALAIKKINLIHPPYSLEKWKIIHKELFGDIYPWAGSIRTVDISKGNTRFCNTGRINYYGNSVFAAMEKEKWLQNLDFDNFIARLAYYFSELNVLHPFREGNGRTQRLLFESILLNCEYTVDWSFVTPTEWVNANIEAYSQEPEIMKSIFCRILKRIA